MSKVNIKNLKLICTCKTCDYKVNTTISDLFDIGVPTCPDCEEDLEYDNEAEILESKPEPEPVVVDNTIKKYKIGFHFTYTSGGEVNVPARNPQEAEQIFRDMEPSKLGEEFETVDKLGDVDIDIIFIDKIEG